MARAGLTAGTSIALAAGRGQRFVDAGYDLPKPIIPVLGKPCIDWAVESFPQSENLIIVLNGDHIASHKLDRTIQEKYPKAEIIILPKKLSPVTFKEDKRSISVGTEFPNIVRKYFEDRAEGTVTVIDTKEKTEGFLRVEPTGVILEIVESGTQIMNQIL